MMEGNIWWSQIGNSLRLLSAVTNQLRDCASAVLQVPTVFPWRRSFYDAVDLRRGAFGGERRMMRLPWREAADPGCFILEELCSPEVRAEYWPGDPCARYLAELDDLVLNDYYVWITGIHSKEDLTRWTEFVRQYLGFSGDRRDRAVFVLEYDGPDVTVTGLDRIVYTVEDYDCRVFCLEAAAALRNTHYRSYQAELAGSIGCGNPELCTALLETGEALLRDPEETTCRVLEDRCDAEGRPFSPISSKQVASCAWKAGISLFFPILEQLRMDIITRHEHRLRQCLPISNSNGEKVTDPYDLEIGAIWHIAAGTDWVLSAEERQAVSLCRRVRNLLAHNRLPGYEDVKALLAL